MALAITENQIPIKQRMLEHIRKHADSKGRVSTSPDTLGKLFGLNGHDLAKNLDQLSSENLIELVWHAGRMVNIKLRRNNLNEAVLASKAAAKRPVAERTRDWLRQQQTQKDGWIYVTPRDIQRALGIEAGNPVSVAVSDMQSAGKLETRRQGMRIIAMRLIDAQAPMHKTTESPQPAPTTELSVFAHPDVRAALNGKPAEELPEEPDGVKFLRNYRDALEAAKTNPFIQVNAPNGVAMGPQDQLDLLSYIEKLQHRVQSR
jgi:hypothetical protein